MSHPWLCCPLTVLKMSSTLTLLPLCCPSTSLSLSPCSLTALSCPQSACGFPRHCCRLLVRAPSSPPCGPLGPCPVSAPIPLLPDAFSTPFPLPSDLAQLSSMSALSASPLGFLPLAATPEHHQSVAGWLVPQLCQLPSPFTPRLQEYPALPLASLGILLGHLLARSGFLSWLRSGGPLGTRRSSGQGAVPTAWDQTLAGAQRLGSPGTPQAPCPDIPRLPTG